MDCNKLVNDYLSWLRSNISVCKIGQACEITAPFLDRHNDFVQFYVRPEDGRLRLSDDGYTVRDLEQSGVDFSSARRLRLLQTALRGFGVAKRGDELTTEARPDELPQKVHALLQAIVAVNDMFVTAKPIVETLFHEDVEQYLRSHRIRFTPNVQFIGQSHLVHNFDFVVPASEQAPERIIRAINRPSRDSITSLLFAWSDTKQVRPAESQAYAFLNDEEKSPSGTLINALKEYGIEPVIWSRREQVVDRLAA
ncbi:DUF1829 domain-containing protein [Fontivita pretiosa]|uniref:DUF1829 domain-containing protein n=1 Tax=Fontivita pretiosa TaxID=2989684 RepID=UPI003D169950